MNTDLTLEIKSSAAGERLRGAVCRKIEERKSFIHVISKVHTCCDILDITVFFGIPYCSLASVRSQNNANHVSLCNVPAKLLSTFSDVCAKLSGLHGAWILPAGIQVTTNVIEKYLN